MMKNFSRIAAQGVLAMFGIFSTASAEVAVGDSKKSVIDSLGEPTGQAAMNGVEAYTFERGRVLFRNGRVSSYTIVSEEEAESQRESAERQREERLEEGRELRDEKVNDEAFAESSPRERLAFWEAFRQKYPEVDVGLEGVVAARQVEMQQRQEVRDLELRALEAKAMADVPEKAAPSAAPYYGAGFPLVFTDPLQRTGVKGKVDLRFDERRTLMPRTTPRERALPLQDLGRFSGVHPLRSPQAVQRVHRFDRRSSFKHQPHAKSVSRRHRR